MKTKVSKIVINESNIPEGLDVTVRFRSFSEIRTGIFTLLQRIKIFYPNAKVFYLHDNPNFMASFLKRNPNCEPYNNEAYDLEYAPIGYCPWELFPQISEQMDKDLSIYKDLKKWITKIKVKPEKYSVQGKSKNLYIHPNAIIYPNVVFDVTSGPIVIDKGVKITSFSFLEGPLYVAPDASIDSARITGSTIIGQNCKIGGEIENSIFGDFSNKHHEGFVGHSYIGNWVNLGALSTTSDLKNNYGIVRIQIAEKKINTNTIKFGSIIGDYTKIAIGTMLNTGTVIDMGCNITDSKVKGYVPAFTWTDGNERYRLDHFLKDTKKIMARRDKSLNTEDENLIRQLYEDEIP
ncbi:MAG: glucose-1-phosphate thymidylyltransferase [Leptospiraceae bacterium]|nr:glucose-1-phosphate thymidylyltransferase [Leptospiraceae bacterium]MCP5496445.1 glucose-1-phosphate thymidylyltransferase [Leptospiraceae bacterium]